MVSTHRWGVVEPDEGCLDLDRGNILTPWTAREEARIRWGDL